MSSVARDLSKLLVAAAVGALMGGLAGEIVVGYGWEASALMGGCVFVALGILYGLVTVRSEPTSRRAIAPYNGDD